jgi:hypothetical protein
MYRDLRLKINEGVVNANVHTITIIGETCMRVCMYVCIKVYMYVCMKVYMYVCIKVYMYVCMYVCIKVYMSVCMFVCMYMHTHVCMYTPVRSVLRVYLCVHVWLERCQTNASNIGANLRPQM